jgi:UTP-glucose-1-phosphate uridylyltransferase
MGSERMPLAGDYGRRSLLAKKPVITSHWLIPRGAGNQEQNVIRKTRKEIIMKPTLVILAAGIGNRYGGLKQMDAVGPSGETIMDYSIYDAVRAGFGKAVFIIRKAIEAEFKEVIWQKLKGRFEVEYVFQELEDIPPGTTVPSGRAKPWGTTHAVLVAERNVREPFAVINADDFYGRQAFEAMAHFLISVKADDTVFALVGYRLGSTLSEHGSVARGVCDVDDRGRLKAIFERTKIEKTSERIAFKDEMGRVVLCSGNETASMNFWGFTPAFFPFAKREFKLFLGENRRNPKSELYIPLVINILVKRGEAEVRVLDGGEKWFGVTYLEDKSRVVAEIDKLVGAGLYPRKLWA